MELTLLGTGTCAPNPLRGPAGYFLAHGPSFLIDPGPGACHRAIAEGLDPYGVEAIVITHFHLDHTGDLMPYLFNYKHSPADAPRPDIKIIAPEGFTTQIYQKLLEVYGGWVESSDYAVRIEEMGDTIRKTTGFTIRSLPVAHGAGAIGYRFEKEGGASLVYSGDSGYCDELVRLATGADALLIECSFPNGEGMEGHMTPEGVAQTGILSGVKKLILTHFYPAVDTSLVADVIRDHGYDGEIIVGEDGMKIDI